MQMRMRAFAGLMMAALTLAMMACGGGAGKSSQNPGAVTLGAAGNAVVTIGDAPSDRILSFEVTLTSIMLTNSSGGTVSVLANPTRVEVSHLAGTFSTLAQINVPQGSYTAAALTISHPEITFLDSNGAIVEKEIPLTNATTTVNFSPTLVVGSNAVSINFDLNVAQSVSFDAAGNASVSPVVAMNTAVVTPGDDNPEDGEIEDIKGTVQSVSGSSFTVAIANGAQNLKFNTDSSTKFEGISGASALINGMAVEVSGGAQLDGSLLASKVDVEVEQVGEAELEGLITSVAGSPATSLKMIVHMSEALSPLKPDLGSTTTVVLDSRTRFRINSGKVSVGSAPFNTNFDGTNISAGQQIEASTEPPSSSSEVGRTITLHDQALVGTVSGLSVAGSGTSFTLTLASDSAFAAITGQTSVSVFQSGGSQPINNGDRVRVRGLLFGGATYHMVAGNIDHP